MTGYSTSTSEMSDDDEAIPPPLYDRFLSDSSDESSSEDDDEDNFNRKPARPPKPKLKSVQKKKRKRPSRRISKRCKFKREKQLANESLRLANITNNKCNNVKVTHQRKAKIYCDLHYDYTADPSKPVWQNKQNTFSNMTSTSYHQKSSNLGYHDLTDTIPPPPKLGRLLSLGRKFIIQRPKVPLHHYEKNLDRFSKDVRTKYIFKDDNSAPLIPYSKDPNFIPDPAPPRIEEAIAKFHHSINTEVRAKYKNQSKATNLTKEQQGLLHQMMKHPTLMIIGSDKNLGQCIIERQKHHELVWKQHLGDKETYEQLTKNQANIIIKHATDLWYNLHNTASQEKAEGLRLTCFSDSQITYVKREMRKSKRHSQFYVLAKVHKNKIPIPLCPVVGAAGSKLFGISTLLDTLLQPLLHRLATYCSNSNQVIHRFTKIMKELKSAGIPPTTKYYLVTVDAVSMHTNMMKDEIITNIRQLLNKRFMHISSNFPIEEILEALTIILDHNVFAYGDTFWRQLKGMAIGAPVACVVATLFFAYHEIKHMIPTFSKWLMIFMRYIDDGIMIWKIDINDNTSKEAFEMFKQEINKYASLTWTVSNLLSEVNFLDLTITITKNHDIIFAPYAKPFHLYQYPPHHSAHPPGVLRSIINGHLLTTWLHSTKKSTCKERVRFFCKKLIESNHQPGLLRRYFEEAASFVQAKLGSSNQFTKALTRTKKDDENLERRYRNELAAITIPPPNELLTFAAQYSNNNNIPFPSFVPSKMPALETLYRRVNGPIKPLISSPTPPNTLFFHVMYHPRDISRLTIRKIYEEHCEKVFREEMKVEKFTVCYHRDKNLKEHLSPSAYKSPSPNENISEYFKKFDMTRDN